jgi:hypothetical protein
MTEGTSKTVDLLAALMQQLHRDTEVLNGLVQAYQHNVSTLVDLTGKLLDAVRAEKEREVRPPDNSTA